MVDDAPAKVWSDQRDLPIHLGDAGDGFRLPFKEKWRLPDALAALIGFCVTAALVTLNLENGNALPLLVAGVAVTTAAVWALGRLPAVRPSIRTRLRWWLANARPRVWCSHRSTDPESATPQ
jgi:hypothetical protein